MRQLLMIICALSVVGCGAEKKNPVDFQKSQDLAVSLGAKSGTFSSQAGSLTLDGAGGFSWQESANVEHDIQDRAPGRIATTLKTFSTTCTLRLTGRILPSQDSAEEAGETALSFRLDQVQLVSMGAPVGDASLGPVEEVCSQVRSRLLEKQAISASVGEVSADLVDLHARAEFASSIGGSRMDVLTWTSGATSGSRLYVTDGKILSLTKHFHDRLNGAFDASGSSGRPRAVTAKIDLDQLAFTLVSDECAFEAQASVLGVYVYRGVVSLSFREVAVQEVQTEQSQAFADYRQANRGRCEGELAFWREMSHSSLKLTLGSPEGFTAEGTGSNHGSVIYRLVRY